MCEHNFACLLLADQGIPLFSSEYTFPELVYSSCFQKFWERATRGVRVLVLRDIILVQ